MVTKLPTVKIGKANVTLDVQLRQLRIVKGTEIKFVPLYTSDLSGLDYLWTHDKKKFRESVKQVIAESEFTDKEMTKFFGIRSQKGIKKWLRVG